MPPLVRTGEEVTPQGETEMILALKTGVALLPLPFLVFAHQQVSHCYPKALLRGKPNHQILMKTKGGKKLTGLHAVVSTSNNNSGLERFTVSTPETPL